jgi:hypothetical protein
MEGIVIKGTLGGGGGAAGPGCNQRVNMKMKEVYLMETFNKGK